MVGNVREWVADAYQDSYIDAPDDQRAVAFTTDVCAEGAVITESQTLFGVTKGGDIGSSVVSARPENRFPTLLTTRSSRVGFRLAGPNAL